MLGALDEGVTQRRGRVHDGGDGMDDVVELLEVRVPEVLLHERGDRLRLTVGVEQRSRLHHSNSFYTTRRSKRIMTRKGADFSNSEMASTAFPELVLWHHHS